MTTTIAQVANYYYNPDELSDKGDPFGVLFPNGGRTYTAHIQPFIPSNGDELIELFNQSKPANSESSFFLPQDSNLAIFKLLAPEDLANLSETSTFMYIATKSSLIWETWLSTPPFALEPVSDTKLTHEQQFKIIFNKAQRKIKPYRDQYILNEKQIMLLRGPNGNDGLFSQTLKIKNDFEAELNRSDDIMIYTLAERIREYYAWAHRDANNNLSILVGGHFNGTRESIDPHSQQGRCLNAIETIPSQITQKEFEETIIDAEKATEISQFFSVASAEISEADTSSTEIIPMEMPYQGLERPTRLSSEERHLRPQSPSDERMTKPEKD
jgi:hypothetical protein